MPELGELTQCRNTDIQEKGSNDQSCDQRERDQLPNEALHP